MSENIRSLKNDLEFGLSKEDEVLRRIRVYFVDGMEIQSTLQLYNNKFYPYDYEGLKTGNSFEVKSRRVKKNQYDTTIIPSHKIRKTDKKQYFLFNFIDKLCYIEYNEEKWKDFKRGMIQIRRSGIIDKPTEHIYIPIKDLEDLVDTNIYDKEVDEKLKERLTVRFD